MDWRQHVRKQLPHVDVGPEREIEPSKNSPRNWNRPTSGPDLAGSPKMTPSPRRGRKCRIGTALPAPSTDSLLTLGASALTIIGATLAACAIPVRRAVRLDPVAAAPAD